MSHDFGVKCETCGQTFLTPNYVPDKFWYVSAVEHWLNNPTHEINHYLFLDKIVHVFCFSEKWRRTDVRSILREINRFKEADCPGEKLSVVKKGVTDTCVNNL